MKTTNLYESLIILHKCSEVISQIWRFIDAHQNNLQKIKEIGVVLTNNIKMETLSFLEEFNNGFFHNIEDEYKPKMMEVRQITAPIIKRIRKWKDLEKF